MNGSANSNDIRRVEITGNDDSVQNGYLHYFITASNGKTVALVETDSGSFHVVSISKVKALDTPRAAVTANYDEPM